MCRSGGRSRSWALDRRSTIAWKAPTPPTEEFIAQGAHLGAYKSSAQSEVSHRQGKRTKCPEGLSPTVAPACTRIEGTGPAACRVLGLTLYRRSLEVGARESRPSTCLARPCSPANCALHGTAIAIDSPRSQSSIRDLVFCSSDALRSAPIQRASAIVPLVAH